MNLLIKYTASKIRRKIHIMVLFLYIVRYCLINTDKGKPSREYMVVSTRTVDTRVLLKSFGENPQKLGEF